MTATRSLTLEERKFWQETLARLEEDAPHATQGGASPPPRGLASDDLGSVEDLVAEAAERGWWLQLNFVRAEKPGRRRPNVGLFVLYSARFQTGGSSTGPAYSSSLAKAVKLAHRRTIEATCHCHHLAEEHDDFGCQFVSELDEACPCVTHRRDVNGASRSVLRFQRFDLSDPGFLPPRRQVWALIRRTLTDCERVREAASIERTIPEFDPGAR